MRTSIIYATKTPLPYPNAASINIVQTCQTLAQLGYNSVLYNDWKPWRLTTLFHNVRKYYGIDRLSFDIHRVPPISTVYFHGLYHLARKMNAIVFTRDLSTASYTTHRGIPTILELHTSKNNSKDILALLENSNLIKLLFISQSLYDSYGLDNNDCRVSVYHDPVNPLRFSDIIVPDKTSCGYVGSSFPGKGLREIVIPLALKNPDIEFHIAGISKRDIIKHSNKDVDLTNINAYGRIQPNRVPRIFNRFNIALLPNQPNIHLPNGTDIGAHTSPLKLFEYMAAGKAIVASDIPVLREVLTHEYNALLIKHNHLDGWIEAIKRLKTDDKLFNRISAQAKNDALKYYSFEYRYSAILSEISIHL